MSGTTKTILTAILFIILGYFAISLVLGLVKGLIAMVLSLAVPILIVGAIAYVIFNLVDRKSIGGGRRRILP